MYDLASFTWPGWGESGVEVLERDLRIGLEAAITNLRLARRTRQGRPSRRREHCGWSADTCWRQTATTRPESASARVRHSPRPPSESAEARLGEAFAALSAVLDGDRGRRAALRRSTIARLAAEEEGAALVEQVATARDVFEPSRAMTGAKNRPAEPGGTAILGDEEGQTNQEGSTMRTIAPNRAPHRDMDKARRRRPTSRRHRAGPVDRCRRRRLGARARMGHCGHAVARSCGNAQRVGRIGAERDAPFLDRGDRRIGDTPAMGTGGRDDRWSGARRRRRALPGDGSYRVLDRNPDRGWGRIGSSQPSCLAAGVNASDRCDRWCGEVARDWSLRKFSEKMRDEPPRCVVF